MNASDVTLPNASDKRGSAGQSGPLLDTIGATVAPLEGTWPERPPSRYAVHHREFAAPH